MRLMIATWAPPSDCGEVSCGTQFTVPQLRTTTGDRVDAVDQLRQQCAASVWEGCSGLAAPQARLGRQPALGRHHPPAQANQLQQLIPTHHHDAQAGQPDQAGHREQLAAIEAAIGIAHRHAERR